MSGGRVVVQLPPGFVPDPSSLERLRADVERLGGSMTTEVQPVELSRDLMPDPAVAARVTASVDFAGLWVGPEALDRVALEDTERQLHAAGVVKLELVHGALVTVTHANGFPSSGRTLFDALATLQQIQAAAAADGVPPLAEEEGYDNPCPVCGHHTGGHSRDKGCLVVNGGAVGAAEPCRCTAVAWPRAR